MNTLINPATLPDNRPWTKQEVAAWLGVSIRTVEKMGLPKLDMLGVRYDPAVVKASIGWGKHRREFLRAV